MKKILWHSNAPHAPTGYGNQTALFTPLIKQTEGLDVVISAYYGRDGAPAVNRWGVLELPRYRDPFGNDVVDAHMGYSGADAIVALCDPFVLTSPAWHRHSTAFWSPIDCAPVSAENWQVLKDAPRVWSMSQFGHAELLKMGLSPEKLDYVPHGVNTDVFKPMAQDEARKMVAQFLGRDDFMHKFIVMTNAANKGSPSRKNFDGMFEAFARFARGKKDVMFYVHAEMTGTASMGDDLMAMVRKHGLEDMVIFPPSYNLVCGMIGDVLLNAMYNMADVFLLLSYGEGFGIPIVEAQAAGLPVVVTAGSAMAELSTAGLQVKGKKRQCLDGRFGCDWWYVDPHHASQKLSFVYWHKRQGLTDDLKNKARAFALDYDYRVVYEKYMLPALRKLVGITDILPSQTDDKKPDGEVQNVA